MKTFPRNFVRTEKFYLLLIAAVSFAVMLPVLLNGIPYGYDLPHHYQCAMTFAESILKGDFYPSWSLHRNFGFGGMESRLYPPVSHYALALFYLIAGDWHLASWLTFLFFAFLGGLGTYLWAKEYMPAGQAVFAGCFYNLLPYHLNQLYNTFFFAEYAGSALLPFTFVFVSRVCRRGRPLDVLGLAVSFAALVLTHLPLTVIGSICFTIYGLALLEREKIFAQLGKLTLGVLGGLGASSFFWIKVLLERDLMAKTLIYADPWLDYRLHFLLTPVQTFDGELPARIYETATFYYDLMLLYAVILALACTIPFLIWEKRRGYRMKSVWIVFGVSLFFAVPLSRPLWDRFPLLQEVQFPWRWVAVVCVFAAVLAAGQLNLLAEWFGNRRRPLALIVAGCILAVVAFSVSQIVRQAPFIETAGVTEYMDNNSRAIGFTFWWTVWTREEAFENKEPVTAGDRTARIETWTATERAFEISAGAAPEARIATFYHPDWQATVDGAPVLLRPDANGALLVPVPDRRAAVRLTFAEPLAVRLGGWLAALVWLSFLLAAALALKNRSSAAISPERTDSYADHD
jgi:hypothetical protein